MQKRNMQLDFSLTFAQGCEKHLNDCKQRNLAEGTLRHYRYEYAKLCAFFGADMPLSEMDAKMYGKYVVYLNEKYTNDTTKSTHIHDFMVILRYWIAEGDIESFDMQTIKAGKSHIRTYTEDELRILLARPNKKQCTFREYQGWVMANFLFSTGVRQRSLINIQIRDVDFDNAILTVRVTKNRKILVIPLNHTMLGILREYLRHRQHKSPDDWLFCNVFGQQLVRNTCYRLMYDYNKNRGVETTGMHRYRHTFAKQWILNGGNVVSLSRLLGHSSLNITQNYINLLTTDLSKQVDEINLLDKYAGRKKIKM